LTAVRSEILGERLADAAEANDLGETTALLENPAFPREEDYIQRAVSMAALNDNVWIAGALIDFAEANKLKWYGSPAYRDPIGDTVNLPSPSTLDLFLKKGVRFGVKETLSWLMQATVTHPGSDTDQARMADSILRAVKDEPNLADLLPLTAAQRYAKHGNHVARSILQAYAESSEKRPQRRSHLNSDHADGPRPV
jgi:hypothetical protein